jgi:hypothetical protein
LTKEEDSMIGVIFFIFWLFVVGIMIAFNAYNVVRPKDVIDIETETSGRVNDPGLDFASILRELDSLRKDGLITEEEFRKKREEIIGPKW